MDLMVFAAFVGGSLSSSSLAVAAATFLAPLASPFDLLQQSVSL